MGGGALVGFVGSPAGEVVAGVPAGAAGAALGAGVAPGVAGVVDLFGVTGAVGEPGFGNMLCGGVGGTFGFAGVSETETSSTSKISSDFGGMLPCGRSP